MSNADLKKLLQKVVELVMPNLRHYYRVVRKAKVIKTYASNGSYWADVQPLRNDESIDENEPVITQAEIPVLWGGKNRGIVCPPEVGTYCDLEYYDGDPNYPRISNFRWHGNKAPDVEIGGLIIQKEAGTSIKIDSQKNIIQITPGNWNVNIGGDTNISVEGKTTIISNSTIELDGGSGNVTGIVTQDCTCAFTGKPHSDYSGNITGSK
ncbi:Baseplate assembly protein [Candidatus Magnetomoraceae bacterium gMMP-15]